MVVHSNNRRGRTMLFWVASIMLVAGCASTPPQPKFTHAMVAGSRIAASDTVDVLVETAPNINVLPAERDLVAQKIKARIDDRKTKNSSASPPRTVQVLLHVTRYEKGSAFARAMLAGLGQIHLDGTIYVYQMPDRVLLEDFDLQKTFAWGGIYGASTSMEEIQDTFADGVAATVTGQLSNGQKTDGSAHRTSN